MNGKRTRLMEISEMVPTVTVFLIISKNKKAPDEIFDH